MPELPEVEVVRRGLVTHLTGATLRDVDVLHPRTGRRYPGGSAALAQALEGATITAINRRGKYLWCVLESESTDLTTSAVPVLLIHLGMSGQIIIDDGTASLRPHCRMRAHISGGRSVSFVDQRTFGYLTIDRLIWDPRTERWIPSLAQHIAPDPLEEGFDMEVTVRELRRHRVPLKSALLNQEIISGVGNIYADEALWAASLHGARLTSGLSYAQLTTVLTEVQAVMRRALAVGGTSFDALYVNTAGEPGYFARSLHSYGKAGEPCDRCGTPLVSIVLGGRSHTYCPSCQKLPVRTR
ncbi:bifunctional DNA-formamidopyrimidine glycosylase/DNA-(apurinic or apyrimidinic site) lyase [Lawsonella clevelandensis]|uniref:bifunctional DNA-formamidopyrimidine glycosylase/DNA-(apurinic or apyrimidinic site) lyase n=1 Tax=Lawsonella clevelandensis TaxID=1528099 RepID=UPI0023F3EAA9|nr:bifunctional DNA-formamidopyrimidine glycosylase/DNA-(apurinic or apyrimidinic site) lyase [Lawsonella clevelandensis]